MSKTASTPKIMVIRHAEKPTGNIQAMKVDGSHDPESLIVQGWQRAGALTTLFAPFNGPLQNPALATPTMIYASGYRKEGAPKNGDSKSRRPVETVTPLSQRLGLTINESFGKDDKGPEDMVADAIQQSGVVLIAWQHQEIAQIANAILGNTSAPQTWPGDRFDLVWVFDLNTTTGQYALTQVPQNLLAGDLNTPIA